MKRSPWFFLVPVGIVVAVLAVILYFVHPLAPLVLLASLLVQVPIIVIVTRVNMTHGYEDRAYERSVQYKKDGDAAACLAAEEREASSAGFEYWSPRAKNLSRLNRAGLLADLDRPAEAALLLADIDTKAIDKTNRQRFDEITARMREPVEEE